MGDDDAVARRTELVEIERAGDGDTPSAALVPTAADATADCGVSYQVEGVVSSEPRSCSGQELHEIGKSEMHEKEEVGVLAVVHVMLSTPHNATFFAAVGLSGMGAGVIDMFLFIRQVLVCVHTSLRRLPLSNSAHATPATCILRPP